ncbi:tripartite tricarboxylate transporter TctB family protein [Cereibacter sp. SYSU M97828]|nr:tripartite tricarboxylate transporter TctB family protein [Cereibacter flavus]
MNAARGDGPDLLTAGLFAGFGALGLWLARDLDQGTMAQMGAGYLPRAVCAGLILLGGVIGAMALRRDAAPIEGMRLRPLLVIVGSIAGFAFLAEHGGFVAASLWLIIAGSLADPGGRWRTVLMLAGGLTAFGALVFVYGLGVQMELWPI